MRYPGGKGGAGVFQTLINLMPAHDVYIETHVGGGNLLERKKPAASSIAIDIDDGVCAYWRRQALPALDVVNGDAARWLRERDWTGHELVYSDPPYVMSSRRGGAIYKHEYTDEQHVELVSLLLAVPAAVMISGYRSAMYDKLLAGWTRVDFKAMTRRGMAIESVWLNFEPPAVPADLSYVGANYRERERIKRRKLRWVERLRRMDAAERAVIIEALAEVSCAIAENSGDISPSKVAVVASAAGSSETAMEYSN